MCGIVSVFDPAGGVAAPPLRAALAAMSHRGPDDRGVWSAPDGRAALGHVRLAVVDVPGNRQPILSEDGQVCLAVNGEFYGYEAVRRELEQRGHRFRTGGDSEIALHLYEELGPEFVHRLRGEFTLALWDRRRGRLLAARDRFGVKPFCYHVADKRVSLASVAKALFALGVPAAWDHDAFFQVAGMQYPLPEQTLFAGIKQLRPGHLLLADERGVETRPYWDLDYPPEGDAPPGDEAELARELRDRLDEAVRLRLRADAPVCFHLSGGLDSTSVVALAARHTPEPPVCFTVCFGTEGYDEWDQARQSAAHLGVALHLVDATPDAMMGCLSDAVYFSEGLAINGHLPAKFLLSRAMRAGSFKVVLSGEGADEVFAGYAHLRRDLALYESGGDAAASLERLKARNPDMAGIQLAEGEGLPLDAVRRRVGFVPSFLEAKATLGLRMRQVLNRDWLAAFADRDPFDLFLSQFDAARLARRHPVDQASYLWARSSLANYILRTLGDGTEMAHSVEGRLPFLDHELFAWARRLPVGMKIRGTTEKYVLREALRPLLPDAVYRREKHPFTAPPLSRDARCRELMRDAFRSAGFEALPFFDAAKVRELLEKVPEMPPREQTATDPVLMLALTAHLAAQRLRLAP
jgi:asparagine synthase (glutamine-hydrolysing)